MLYELLDDGQIVQVEEVVTEVQVARVATHFTWAVHVTAIYQGGLLRAEYRRPAIEGTEWQGQLVEDEERPMLLTVDDSEPVELPVIAGRCEVPLEFEAPGTYRLRVAASFGCVPAELEVTV